MRVDTRYIILVILALALAGCNAARRAAPGNRPAIEHDTWPSFAPTAIVLGPDTRAVSADRKPGDDGLRVRISPTDNYGHTVKWPGRIEIVLRSSLLRGEEICRWRYGPTEAAEKWKESALSGYLFEFIPWVKGKEPSLSNCVLEVTFTTSLGIRLTAEKSLAVKLP